ncbi:MAG: sulfatase [Planctomycetota bacterium]
MKISTELFHFSTSARQWLIGLLGCLLTIVHTSTLLAEQPNILVFLSDDHSQVDSSLYGNTNIPTPNLELLARDGMMFTHAFVASPSCAPSRAAMLTGLMPARNGAEGNHERPHPDVKSLIKNLQKAGYEVAAFGKVAHNNYAPQFGFDHIQTLGSIRVQHDVLLSAIKKYLESRDQNKPVCVFAGTGNPHVPWPDKSTFSTDQVELPPHNLDTPETRRHRAAYYEEIRGLDFLLGDLRSIADQHLGDNTLFIYTSDHGSQWPFGKWNLYDYGTRVPFVAAWKGTIAQGTQSNAMISWVDLLPTLIDIGGGQTQADLDGRSFKQVLLGRVDRHRNKIFTTHTGDKRKNLFPMRSVRTRNWKLIHNVHPQWAHTNHSDIDRKPLAGAYWHEWADLAKKDPQAKTIVDRYFRRDEFELFDLDKDPWEQNNLAELLEHAERLATMKTVLSSWMKDQGDTVKVKFKPRLLSDLKEWHPDFFEERLAREPQPPTNRNQKKRKNRNKKSDQPKNK